MIIKKTLNNNPIIYHKTPQFLSSSYAKGNTGLNNKKLSQNNTGTYFEQILKSNLSNCIVPSVYKRVDGSNYKPDIETPLSIISCKVQETQGTAWQKIILEALDLEYISSQTNKKILLVCSDYSWSKYFYKLEPYLNMLLLNNVSLYTETSFNSISSTL